MHNSWHAPKQSLHVRLLLEMFYIFYNGLYMHLFVHVMDDYNAVFYSLWWIDSVCFCVLSMCRNLFLACHMSYN